MSDQQSRREILRKTAYVVPTVLTLAARPSLASSGSGRCENEDEWEKRSKGEEYGNSRGERKEEKAKKEKKEKKH